MSGTQNVSTATKTKHDVAKKSSQKSAKSTSARMQPTPFRTSVKTAPHRSGKLFFSNEKNVRSGMEFIDDGIERMSLGEASTSRHPHTPQGQTTRAQSYVLADMKLVTKTITIPDEQATREIPHNRPLPTQKYHGLRFTRNSDTAVRPVGPPAMKAARKRQVVYDIPESDSESDSQTEIDAEVGNADDSDSGLSYMSYDSEVLHGRQVKAKEVVESPGLATEGFPTSLVEAIEPYVLPVVRLRKIKRLPFLVWNLQRGFELLCKKRGINMDVNNIEPPQKVSLVYDWWEGEVLQQYQSKMKGWCCPICDLHGTFPTREMLLYHLEQDHKDFAVRCQLLDTGNEWELSVTVPPSKISSPVPVPQVVPEASAWQQETEPDMILDQRSRSTTPTVRQEIDDPVLSWDPSLTTPSGYNRLQFHFPDPPPYDNIFGPAKRKPYLPYKVPNMDGPTVEYSCRPGGAKLYDMLGALPMEEYGILAWQVIDKDEEIFELDDVKDEHKVMHALWARYIFLYRNKFIENFCKGAIDFVEKYYLIIHDAAGWSALRYMLLILAGCRFLTGGEVARVLKEYESLVGMDKWATQGA